MKKILKLTLHHLGNFIISKLQFLNLEGYMLRGNFVQMNIDRPVYTRKRYNALLPQWL